MAHARINLGYGDVDGANRVFRTPVPYVPGSTAYILNGTIHSLASTSLDSPFGYVETNPAAGVITVDTAPLAGDVVQIFFWDRLVEPTPTLDHIVGVLHQPARLRGVVMEVGPERLSGVVHRPKIRGVVRESGVDKVVGTTRIGKIIGVIKEC